MKQSPPDRMPLYGAGIGLRRDLLDALEHAPEQIAFMEVAPENWIRVGNILNRRLRHFTECYPFVCHGLSLSLGSPDPLDKQLLQDIKYFLDEHDIRCYSEHLSYCSAEGHLYDLMPLPFTEEAAQYVSGRIREVQDFLGRQIAIENVSAYIRFHSDDAQNEIDFIKQVLQEADCKLLLDINNVYVNSVNFGFDPCRYIEQIPSERIAYCHIAGHDSKGKNLIVDTHGAEVIPPVWDLLDKTYAQHGVFATLLERDFNFPQLNELMKEINQINQLQHKYRPAIVA